MATDNVSDVGEQDVSIKFIPHSPWRIHETNFIWFDLVCEWANGVERNAEKINGAISHANTSRDL